MIILVLSILIAALVTAHGSAELTPVVIETSNHVEDQSTPVEDNAKLRVDNEATEGSDTERGIPQRLDSMSTSLRERPTSHEALRAIVNAPNELQDVSPFERNEAFTQRMEELGIDMEDVVYGANRLRTYRGLGMMGKYNLELMTAGSMIFERLRRSWGYGAKKLREDVARNRDPKVLEEWEENLRRYGVKPARVYGKMSWLRRREHIQLGSEDLAMMAFGSEVVKNRKIKLPPAPGSPALKRLLKRQNVDPKLKEKLRLLAKDQSLSDKSEEELLRIANHHVIADALREETNQRK